tara:strand:- start:4325 stop:5020 length:696 start_codon:yes stop_codon:yes gene_type:complete
MNDGILGPILELIATGAIGFLSIMFVVVRKRLVKWFTDDLMPKLNKTPHKKLKITDIENATKIREILIELRILTKSDRSCVFQFHNGSVFTTKNPIWKLSNTHESVAPGVSSEIGHLQDIKASSVIECIQSLWTDKICKGFEVLYPEGVSNTKRAIFSKISELEDSYSKSLMIEHGITYTIRAPIHSVTNNCVGFVTLNYCGEQDESKIKGHADVLCRNVAQIQFLLLEGE